VSGLAQAAGAGRAWLATLAVIAAGPQVFAQSGDVDLLHVQGKVYMVHTAAGNMTVQAADEGLLVVDTLSAELVDAVYAQIAPLSAKPIQYILNTHAHLSHSGANASFAGLGRSIFGGNVVAAVDEGVLGASARIVAHENVLLAMAAPESSRSFDDWPTDVFYTNKRELFFNGEGVQILHQPAAHTNGDSIVYFRRSDVISAGDIFRSNEFPFIDRDAGGSVAGIIDGLNAIIDLAIPAFLQEGGTMIIPGRGRLCDEADVLEYRDMVVIVRDRIEDGINKGLSLRQVQSTRPTLGYDWQYGRSNDEWTGEDFVAAIYLELSAQ
jgi:glyoxylase-like metal-dependent hydrolase (beta-lactamase superfamily II)